MCNSASAHGPVSIGAQALFCHRAMTAISALDACEIQENKGQSNTIHDCWLCQAWQNRNEWSAGGLSSGTHHTQTGLPALASDSKAEPSMLSTIQKPHSGS